MDFLFKSKRLHIPGVEYAVPAGLDVNALAQPDADPDIPEPNASSIALLAEYEGRARFWPGTAWPPSWRQGSINC
jgi:hypothetical protein